MARGSAYLLRTIMFSIVFSYPASHTPVAPHEKSNAHLRDQRIFPGNRILYKALSRSLFSEIPFQKQPPLTVLCIRLAVYRFEAKISAQETQEKPFSVTQRVSARLPISLKPVPIIAVLTTVGESLAAMDRLHQFLPVQFWSPTLRRDPKIIHRGGV